MSKIQCPHCEEWSTDHEFCEHCAKLISDQVVSTEKNTSGSQQGKWQERGLICNSVLIHQTIDISDLPRPTSYVDLPLYIEHRSMESILYFKEESLVQPLSVVLQKISKISFDDILILLGRIGEIIHSLHEQKYILGMFDLEDFWMRGEEFSTIKFRITRPLYKLGQVEMGEVSGEFLAQEIHSNHPLSYSTDVMLLGKLFLSLVFQRTKSLGDYNELRYVSHQLQAFLPQVPFSLHSWLGRSVHRLPSERYENVKVQMEDFYYLIDCYQRRTNHGDNVQTVISQYYGDSNEGQGKRREALEKGIVGELNQDRFFYSNDSTKNIAIALLADGISNCKYGSGSIAAQIIKDTVVILWENQKHLLTNREGILDFIDTTIREANERIVTETLKYIPLDDLGMPKIKVTTSEFMGSTLLLTLFHSGKLYAVSIGDSRLYLHSPEEGLQLLVGDQNTMNGLIDEDYSWEDVMDTEHKTSLTQYMGMVDLTFGSIGDLCPLYTVREMGLFNGDSIILCSDGLTDYLHPIGYRNDLWMADARIKQTLEAGYNLYNKEQPDLKYVIDSLIESANKNGGGDNITVLGVHIGID